MSSSNHTTEDALGCLTMTIGFLFSGQGAQYEGMGQQLAQTYPSVAALYDKAKDLLGYDLLTLNQDELNQTAYTQVAIFTLSHAVSTLLKENGVMPSCAAGLSLGEYSALVCAEALTFEEALLLLKQRGELMAQASQSQASKMLAVMNVPRETVEDICATLRSNGHAIWPANYNMTGQIVVAGSVEGIDVLQETLVSAGFKKNIPLAVSGAFHTALMASAAEQMAPLLEKTSFKPLTIPVIGNTYAKDLSGMNLSDVLVKQIVSPVYFEDSLLEMQRLGVNTFIELGPKKVLSTFVKKTVADAVVYNVEDVETLTHCVNNIESE